MIGENVARLPLSITAESLQERWDKLSVADALWIAGITHRLIHALVARYGMTRCEAAQQVLQLLEGHDCDTYEARDPRPKHNGINRIR